MRPASPSGRRLLLVGFALTALLALVAVASRGQDLGRSDDAARNEPPTVIGDYIVTLFAIVMPIGTVLLIFALVAGRRQRMATRQISSLKSALTLLLIIAAVSLAGVMAAERFGGRGDAGQALAPAQDAVRAAQAELDDRRRELEFRWLAAVIFSGILVGIVAAVVIAGLWKRRVDRDPERLAAEALAEELDLTVDDLRREPDLRRAVVAAYARMERSLALHGLPRLEFEAPLEYLSRVLGELHASDEAVRKLTFLFERAKFSTHDVGPEMRDEAIAALIAVRDELRATNDRDRARLELVPGRVPVER